MHPAGSDLPTASPPGQSCRCAVFIKPATTRIKKPPSVQSLFAQARRYLHWGDVTRLLGGHYPSFIATTGSFVKPIWLSPPSTFRLGRGVFAGCYQPLLPAGSSRRYVISENLSCDAWTPIPTVGRLHIPGSSSATAAFPKGSMGRHTVIFRSSDFTADDIFENAVISLCSGLAVCSPP